MSLVSISATTFDPISGETYSSGKSNANGHKNVSHKQSITRDFTCRDFPGKRDFVFPVSDSVPEGSSVVVEKNHDQRVIQGHRYSYADDSHRPSTASARLGNDNRPFQKSRMRRNN